MKTCGYCGRENEDDAVFCSECGQDEFPTVEIETKPEPEPLTPDVSPDEEAAICPFCLFPNLTTRQWCKQCDAPIMGVGFDPLKSAWALGSMWRGVVRGRPKTWVFFGVWAYFLPGVFFAPWAFLSGAYSNSLPLVILSLVYAAIDASMLYQVTRNYLTIPKPKLGHDG